MRNRLVIVLSVVGLLSSVSLQAHHTGSTLLSETTVTLKGVVKNWLWSNPHCLLTLEVTGADGQVVQWVMEAQAPIRSRTAGRYGRIADVVLADGSTLGDQPGGRGRGRGAPVQ